MLNSYFRSSINEPTSIPLQFYGAPTAIRLLLRYDSDFVKRYDRSSLRTLASVGEPINHEAWHWFNDVVGDGRWVMVGGCLDLEIMHDRICGHYIDVSRRPSKSADFCPFYAFYAVT